MNIFSPALRGLSAAVFTALLSAADADLILRSGKIVTVNKKFSIQQAVAVKGGKISAVGSDAAVLKAERGPHTNVIDLQGKTVLPGLVDSHVHAVDAGLSEFRAPLPPLNSFAAVRAYISQQAAKTPKGSGLLSRGPFPRVWPNCRCPRGKLSILRRTIPCFSMRAML